MAGIRNFEPSVKWVDENGFLTERAKGFLRSLWDYIGAAQGMIPGTGLPDAFFLMGGQDGEDGMIGPPGPAGAAGTSINDPVQGTYAPGTFSLVTGKYSIMSKRLGLTTTQRVSLAGTSRLRIT